MTKYLINAGGNYSADGSWSTVSTKDASRVANTTKPTASDDVVADDYSGALTIDANSLALSFNAALHTAGITHNGFSLTVSGNVTLPASGAYTPLITSTIIINATATLNSNAKLLPLVNHTSGTLTLGSNIAFMASKFCKLTLSGTALDLAGYTISGNSVTNRLLIQSSVPGTGKTILNCLNTSFANADFMDITFTKATDLDLSGITGNSGDCGGNTLVGGGTTLTFTPAADQTATGTASITCSTHGWTSRVPLPQDNVSIPNAFVAGRTITWDMPRSGKSITCTCTGSPAFAIANDCKIYGGLVLVAGMTATGNYEFGFAGRGNYTFTSAGITVAWTLGVYCVGGKITHNDDCICKGIYYYDGEWNSGNRHITLNQQYSTLTLQLARTKKVDFGTSLITFSGANINGTYISFSSVTGLTLVADQCTVELTGTSASARDMTGGPGGTTAVWGTFNRVGDLGAGDIQFHGGMSFKAVNISDPVRSISVKINAGIYITIRDPNGWQVKGTATYPITLDSLTAATHYLSSVNIQQTDYLIIGHSQAAGGGLWYAGKNSTNNGNNAGWIFGVPPVSGNGLSMGI